MRELTSIEAQMTSGGVMPAFYVAYVIIGPSFALGVARGVASNQ
jgi:hypothetical protein